MELALAMVILAVVAAAVGLPLLRGSEEEGDGDCAGSDLAELRTRKETKLAEIRDAELERAAGKLSMEDWRRVDRELRAEAIEIIKTLDELEAR